MQTRQCRRSEAGRLGLGTALLVLVCLLAVTGTAWAQAGATGTISGQVSDNSGAVLPGATVVITNKETSITRTLHTDAEGRYSAPNLPPGPYEVTGSMDGFTTVVRSGITLTIGREAVVDMALGVGGVTDQIEVVGEAPIIQTTSASTGGLISQEQITNLPLNGRSYIELATLTPGAILSQTGGQGAGTGFGAKLSVNGSRYQQNLFTVDGTTMNDQYNQAGGVSGNVLGVEAIREFQVLTNSFSAEYGRHTGGIVSAVTKSGTNTFRGTLFEFHRNDAFDARNFFDVASEEQPPFTRNQFGGSAGGPLVRDRLFFFATYEGLRESLGKTTRATVPTQAFRELPMDPRIRPWVDVYPLPNGRLLDANRGDYLAEYVDTTREDYAVARVDYQLAPGSLLFARYTFSDGDKDEPGGNVATGGFTETRAQYLTVEHSMTRGSNFLNRAQVAFSRSDMSQIEYLMEGVTLPQMTFTEITRPGSMGIVSVSGLSGIGGISTSGIPKFHVFNNYQVSNVSTWNRGRHNIRFGGQVEIVQFDVTSDFSTMGSFSFDSLSDFRAARPSQFFGVLSGSDTHRQLRQPIYGLFVQDDIRLRSNLTLNVGLRYEPTGSITEVDGKLAQLVDFANPSATLDDIVILDELVKNPTARNFAPRVGLSWDPRGDGKLSIRAGAGVFNELLTVSNPLVQNTAVRVPPFFTRVGLVAGPNLEIDFPNAFFTQSLGSPTAALEGIQYDYEQPVMYKWNVNAQRELWAGTVVEVGYNGSHGENLWRQIFTNQRMPVRRADGRLFVPPGTPLRQPQFARMRLRVADSSSDYRGLTVGLTKRPSNGVHFQVSYTWAKSEDDGASALGGGDFTNDGEPRNFFDKERGLSPFDVRHSLVANFNYDLPFSDGMTGMSGALLRGWSVGTLVRLRSGYPFSPQVGFDSARTAFGGRYPDLAPGADPNPVLGGIEQYFDPTAFLLPESGVIGNAPRNSVIGPGAATVDLMLAKVIRMGSTQLHLRGEAFNLLNRANFSNPSTALFNSNGTRRPEAGRITSTSTPARQMQFGVKLLW